MSAPVRRSVGVGVGRSWESREGPGEAPSVCDVSRKSNEGLFPYSAGLTEL